MPLLLLWCDGGAAADPPLQYPLDAAVRNEAGRQRAGRPGGASAERAAVGGNRRGGRGRRGLSSVPDQGKEDGAGRAAAAGRGGGRFDDPERRRGPTRASCCCLRDGNPRPSGVLCLHVGSGVEEESRGTGKYHVSLVVAAVSQCLCVVTFDYSQARSPHSTIAGLPSSWLRVRRDACTHCSHSNGPAREQTVLLNATDTHLDHLELVPVLLLAPPLRRHGRLGQPILAPPPPQLLLAAKDVVPAPRLVLLHRLDQLHVGLNHASLDHHGEKGAEDLLHERVDGGGGVEGAEHLLQGRHAGHTVQYAAVKPCGTC